MGCAHNFTFAIAIQPIEKNSIRNRVIYLRCEWTITVQTKIQFSYIASNELLCHVFTLCFNTAMASVYAIVAITTPCVYYC